MTLRSPILLALLVLLAAPAHADHAAECQVAQHLAVSDFPLPKVRAAIAAKRLDIIVIGAGSSSLPGPNGAKNAYPARLQSALTADLAGVAINLTTDVQARRTAAEMVKAMPALLAAKPTLVIWQTGTVDAMQAVDQDHFNAALEHGIRAAQSAHADIILLNSQYSPRTESMIALGPYEESMRWVAVQQEVPLFDRFSMMKVWSDLGTFDFYTATKKLDIAERVHDCLGRLLATFIVEAAKEEKPLSRESDR